MLMMNFEARMKHWVLNLNLTTTTTTMMMMMMTTTEVTNQVQEVVYLEAEMRLHAYSSDFSSFQ
jgi:hypothetical protein